MLLFVSKDMSFFPERKAVLFDMLSDPEKAKEDFIYLLEWFYENAFSVIEPKLERMLPEVATDLKKEIEASGIKFLKTLIKNIDYASYEVLERTVICPSYFSELVSSPGGFHPQALSEPDLNLSIHPAPIIQPNRISPLSSVQRDEAPCEQELLAIYSLLYDLFFSCTCFLPTELRLCLAD
jgi:hypothetical protein